MPAAGLEPGQPDLLQPPRRLPVRRRRSRPGRRAQPHRRCALSHLLAASLPERMLTGGAAFAAPTSASPGGNLLTDESKKPARRKGAAERRRRYSVAGDGLILALTEGMNEAADDAGDIEAGQRPASTGRRASLVAFSADTQVREPPLGRSSSLEHIVDSAGKTRHAPFSHRILVAAAQSSESNGWCLAAVQRRRGAHRAAARRSSWARWPKERRARRTRTSTPPRDAAAPAARLPDPRRRTLNGRHGSRGEPRRAPPSR